jgi:FAD-dependent urate hydroxylase
VARVRPHKNLHGEKSMTTTTALVIGGGIAGPVTAMALARAGIQATVYEAYHGPADGIGGMLGIAPNGVNALRVLDAADAVLAVGDPISAMVLRSWTGKTLATFGGKADEPIMHVVWRADLHRALHDMALDRGVHIEHGRRLVRLNDTVDGVTAEFADGSTASADILIGADGIRSTVRPLIDPTAPQPRYTGLLGFGGRTAPGVHTGLSSTDGAMHMVYGKRAFFGYAVAEDSSAGWYVNLPSRQPMTFAEAKAVGARQWLRTLREVFAADRIPALELLRHTDPDDLVITGGLADLPHVSRWYRGRVVLVGDSAHATSPSSGQGASIAIESAVQLARCLRDLPVDEAFPAYERLRRTRVERIIAAGARTSSNKAAGPVARVLRDALLPMTMKAMAKPEKMAWQFDYRIDWPTTVDAAPAGR